MLQNMRKYNQTLGVVHTYCLFIYQIGAPTNQLAVTLDGSHKNKTISCKKNCKNNNKTGTKQQPDAMIDIIAANDQPEII